MTIHYDIIINYDSMNNNSWKNLFQKWSLLGHQLQLHKRFLGHVFTWGIHESIIKKSQYKFPSNHTRSWKPDSHFYVVFWIAIWKWFSRDFKHVFSTFTALIFPGRLISKYLTTTCPIISEIRQDQQVCRYNISREGKKKNITKDETFILQTPKISNKSLPLINLYQF